MSQRAVRIYAIGQVMADNTEPLGEVTFADGKVQVTGAESELECRLSAFFSASSPGLASGGPGVDLLLDLAPGSVQHFDERVADLYRIGLRAVEQRGQRSRSSRSARDFVATSRLNSRASSMARK